MIFNNYMKKYSPYHKIIPERFEILEKIKNILGKECKIHLNINYAKRKLPIMSYVPKFRLFIN
jgi:hypothetical protein